MSLNLINVLSESNKSPQVSGPSSSKKYHPWGYQTIRLQKSLFPINFTKLIFLWLLCTCFHHPFCRPVSVSKKLLSLIFIIHVCPADKKTENILKTTASLKPFVYCLVSLHIFSFLSFCAQASGPSALLDLCLSPGCYYNLPDVLDLHCHSSGELATTPLSLSHYSLCVFVSSLVSV